ncbi:MAG: PadR family transcriptional regulator [Eubacteriales bacterium]|nr:PadR family transcriptional regulator [Eubacteriales bacterium]
MKKDKQSPKETGHSFEDYFKRAVNPLFVLLLLSERPMYVYEMAQELEKRSDGAYTISLLYPVIYRLSSQGYIRDGQKVISADNRVRQYYEITPEGASYLLQIQDVYDQMSAVVKQIRDSSGGIVK